MGTLKRLLTPNTVKEKRALLDSLFPNWQCECKQYHAERLGDPEWEYPSTRWRCPTCEREYGNENEFEWFTFWRTPEGIKSDHICWPEYGSEPCVICGLSTVRGFISLCASCEQARKTYSQDDLMEAEFNCSQCGRVWDGFDWYKDWDFFCFARDWWDMREYAEDCRKTGRWSCGFDLEELTLKLMDYCEQNCNCDPSVFGHLENMMYRHESGTATAEQVGDALQNCMPAVSLLCRKGTSRPYCLPHERPSQLVDTLAGDTDEAPILQLKSPMRRLSRPKGRPRDESVQLRRRFVKQMSAEGKTPGEIASELVIAKQAGELPDTVSTNVETIRQDLLRIEKS